MNIDKIPESFYLTLPEYVERCIDKDTKIKSTDRGGAHREANRSGGDINNREEVWSYSRHDGTNYLIASTRYSEAYGHELNNPIVHALGGLIPYAEGIRRYRKLRGGIY